MKIQENISLKNYNTFGALEQKHYLHSSTSGLSFDNTQICQNQSFKILFKVAEAICSSPNFDGLVIKLN